MLNRREFLVKSGVSGISALLRQPAQMLNKANNLDATLTLFPGDRKIRIPEDFTGLSYESDQLSEPDYFSVRNTALLGLVRTLGSRGVLRFGGGTSDQPTADTEAAGSEYPLNSHGEEVKRSLRKPIPETAIANLAAFLEATNWTLIYGLNFGSGTPAQAQAEARLVLKHIGAERVVFQIGNEPDLFGGRKWDFLAYYSRWAEFAKELRKLGSLSLGGPDTAEIDGVDWVIPFAEKERNQIQLLSGHYYRQGPPQSELTTVAHMLKADPRLDTEIAQANEACSIAGVPFRMTEGNSCFWGGKPGVSDVFGSALWGADFMLKVASKGYSGVNFHGGGSRSLGAFLEGKLPGTTLAGKQDEIDRLSRAYTPIAGAIEAGFYARPLYYGMLLAGHLSGGTLVENVLDAGNTNITAYACEKEKRLVVALLNKDLDRSVKVRVCSSASMPHEARVWRLVAPSADSKHGITLAGTEVGGEGQWAAKSHDVLIAQGGQFEVGIPAASAILIFI